MLICKKLMIPMLMIVNLWAGTNGLTVYSYNCTCPVLCGLINYTSGCSDCQNKIFFIFISMLSYFSSRQLFNSSSYLLIQCPRPFVSQFNLSNKRLSLNPPNGVDLEWSGGGGGGEKRILYCLKSMDRGLLICFFFLYFADVGLTFRKFLQHSYVSSGRVRNLNFFSNQDKL